VHVEHPVASFCPYGVSFLKRASSAGHVAGIGLGSCPSSSALMYGIQRDDSREPSRMTNVASAAFIETSASSPFA